MANAARRRSNQIYDARRMHGQSWRQLYKIRAWAALRRQVLSEEPLCRRCTAKGLTVASRHVDHIVAHKGNTTLFFARSNLQGLCVPCHNRDKQREEVRGHTDALDDDGWPTDPRHPANAHHGAAVAQQHALATPPGGVKSLGPVPPGPAAARNANSREIGEGGPK